MKKNNLYILLIIGIIGVTSVLADNPTPIDPKEKELNELLIKSEERLKKINIISQSIDKVATEQVVNMKQDIENLKKENNILTLELNEIKTNTDTPIIESTPFILEPISSTEN
jgi:hypothetical protein